MWRVAWQVDGLRGPESDERHLLRTKMICKFYAPDYAKFEDKGHALGAIKIRAAIRENSKARYMGCCLGVVVQVWGRTS